MNKIVNLDFDDINVLFAYYICNVVFGRGIYNSKTMYNRCKIIVSLSLTGLLIGKRKIIARILVFGNYLPWYFVKELF